MPWQGAVLLGFVLSLCQIFLLILLERLILEQRLVAARAGNYTLLTGYARFLRVSRNISRLLLTLQIVIWLATLLVVFFATVEFSAPFGLSICCIGAGVALSLLTNWMVYGLVIDRRALADILGISVSVGEMMWQRLKQGLFGYLFPFLVIEGVGVFILFNVSFLGTTLLLAVFVALFLKGLGSAIFGDRVVRWVYAATPIQETQWTDLEPRIRQWAEVVGVKLHSIYLLRETRFNSHGIVVAGLRQPSLFLSDMFLNNADWRQQDALVVVTLILLAKQTLRYAWLLRLCTALFVILLVSLGVYVITYADINGGLVFIALALLIALLICRRVLQRWFIALYYEADFQAASITGDPLALLVALNTLAKLNPRTASLSVKRVRLLERMMEQTGPRASWANTPVPSFVPVARALQSFTVPIDQASSLAPVPSGPYPIAEGGIASHVGGGSQNYEHFVWN